jgi:hypothetical protein
MPSSQARTVKLDRLRAILLAQRAIALHDQEDWTTPLEDAAM